MKALLKLALLGWAATAFSTEPDPFVFNQDQPIYQFGDDVDTIRTRFIEWVRGAYNTNRNAQITSFLNGMSPEGSWSDIDYRSGCEASRAVWKAADHMSRVFLLSAAVLAKAPFANQNLTSKAVLSFSYWLNNDYTTPGCLSNGGTANCPCGTPGFWNTNWWWQWIQIPNTLGRICIALQDNLDAHSKSKCDEILARVIPGLQTFTAANQMAVAKVVLWLALFRRDPALLLQATNAANGQFALTSAQEDGIKIDDSFLMHSAQPYWGLYGTNQYTNYFDFLRLTGGTSFSLSQTEREVFTDGMVKGMHWSVYYNKILNTPIFDISTVGRYPAVPNSLSAAATVLSPSYLAWLTTSWPRQPELQSFFSTLRGSQSELNGTKMFWKSDYFSYRRPGVFMSIRMFSARTRNSECLNFENPFGLHLADGATYVYNHGNEYTNIFPVWDWFLIPGSTVNYNGHQLVCNRVSQTGIERSVGGLTDGRLAVVAMRFTSNMQDRLKFKKGWFVFESITAVMVSDVSVAKGFAPNVISTMDQKWVNGEVVTNLNNMTTGDVAGDNIWWLWHDEVGYIFPMNTRATPADRRTVSVSIASRSGDWSSLGAYTGTVSGSVFTTTIRHDNLPVFYYMVPKVTKTDFLATVRKLHSDLSPVTNTAAGMGMIQRSTDTVSLIFWQAGSINVGLKKLFVTANGPCNVMIQRVAPSQTQLRIHVSDPTQLLTYVMLTFNRQMTCLSCKPSAVSGSTDVVVTLPIGEEAGKSTDIVVTLTSGAWMTFEETAEDQLEQFFVSQRVETTRPRLQSWCLMLITFVGSLGLVMTTFKLVKTSMAKGKRFGAHTGKQEEEMEETKPLLSGWQAI